MAQFVISIPDDAVQLVGEAFAYVFASEWKIITDAASATPSTPVVPDKIEFARWRIIAFIQNIVKQYQERPQPSEPIKFS